MTTDQLMMNPTDEFYDDVPFVREECGDTMWDETVLNQLTTDMTPQRLLLPPFTLETARQKVQLAEDAWNSRNPQRIAQAYTHDSEWRNREEFISGRDQIVDFLTRKWQRELDYKLKKEYWAHTDNRLAVRFEYEYRTADGQWFRAYGNENWEFDAGGLMRKRFASINDLAIQETERRL